jgi:hypothetical protein
MKDGSKTRCALPYLAECLFGAIHFLFLNPISLSFKLLISPLQNQLPSAIIPTLPWLHLLRHLPVHQIQDGEGQVNQEARSMASADLVEEGAVVVVVVVAEVVVVILQSETRSQKTTLNLQSPKTPSPLLLLR